MEDADHEETSPDAGSLIVSKLYCSLKEQAQPVQILEGTLAARAYPREFAVEQFMCNFGLNPDYRFVIIREPLRLSGIGTDGEARIIELHHHPFFVATLFVPQLNTSKEHPHPLIVEFLKAAS